jgi:hypothetical protein
MGVPTAILPSPLLRDESDCGGNSEPFKKGCEAYARDHGEPEAKDDK